MKNVCPQQTKFLASFHQLPNIQPKVKNTIRRYCSLFEVCISDVSTEWLVALCCYQWEMCYISVLLFGNVAVTGCLGYVSTSALLL